MFHDTQSQIHRSGLRAILFKYIPKKILKNEKFCPKSSIEPKIFVAHAHVQLVDFTT